MENNEFSAGVGQFITQDIKVCDLCQKEFTDASYTLMIGYIDQYKLATMVCPECMKRLKFKRRVVLNDEDGRLMEELDKTTKLIKNKLDSK